MRYHNHDNGPSVLLHDVFKCLHINVYVPPSVYLALALSRSLSLSLSLSTLGSSFIHTDINVAGEKEIYDFSSSVALEKNSLGGRFLKKSFGTKAQLSSENEKLKKSNQYEGVGRRKGWQDGGGRECVCKTSKISGTCRFFP